MYAEAFWKVPSEVHLYPMSSGRECVNALFTVNSPTMSSLVDIKDNMEAF